MKNPFLVFTLLASLLLAVAGALSTQKDGGTAGQPTLQEAMQHGS